MHPCPESDLRIAVRNMREYQKLDDQPEDVQAQKAVVGVSRYNGDRRITFDDVVSFTAAKYLSSQAAMIP